MYKLLLFVAVLHVSCAYKNYVLEENEATPSGSECNTTIVGWIPHPDCCEKYYLSFHGNLIEKSCAPKLHFSAEQRKCMLPQLAECEINAFCPAVDDVQNPVFLADKNDCTKYFVCFSGKAIKRSCAEGLFFDVNSNWCTFPENVTCNSTALDASTIKLPVAADTSVCWWSGNLKNEENMYMKSLCYYNYEESYEDASKTCQKHGMRLMRVKDGLDQTRTMSYLNKMFGERTGGIYHVSGTNYGGSWYHDDDTPIYNDMKWTKRWQPSSGCLILNNEGHMGFDSKPCSQKMHSVCEYYIDNIDKVKFKF